VKQRERQEKKHKKQQGSRGKECVREQGKLQKKQTRVDLRIGCGPASSSSSSSSAAEDEVRGIEAEEEEEEEEAVEET
jgi:hypothetical protein